MAESHYKNLISRIDGFIKRYYRNALIKGSLFFLGILIVNVVLFTTLEYLFHFGTYLRAALFYTFLLFVFGALYYYVLNPSLKLFKLRNGITYKQASVMIGDHFEEVKDKLLNVILLNEQASSRENKAISDLISAGIEQKAFALDAVPFKRVIDFKKNKKYLKFLLAPLVILLLMSLTVPDVLSDGSKRLVAYNSEFVREWPYAMTIENESLEAIKSENFDLKVKVEGDEIPESIDVVIGDQIINMGKKGKRNYVHTFRHVNENIEFKLRSPDFETQTFEISVFSQPKLLDLGISLEYPSYIGQVQDVRKNSGDLIVPEGTKIWWNLQTSDVDDVLFSFDGKEEASASREGTSLFKHNLVARKTQDYYIRATNEFFSEDTLFYRLVVQPDQFPEIFVAAKTDTLFTAAFFSGSVSDDYGLSSLQFHYRISSDTANVFRHEKLELASNVTSFDFNHFLDMKSLQLSAGQTIEYYFSTSDNDVVNGRKTAKTSIAKITLPKLEEIREMTDNKSEDLKKDMKEAMDKAKELKEELDEWRKSNVDKNQKNWEDSRKMEDIIEQHNELQKQVQSIEEEIKKNNEFKSNYSKPNEDLLRKQEQLEDLMQNLMNEEMKELLEEMEKLLNEMDLNEMNKLIDEMKISEEDLEKELDRSLELYKQLEFEIKLDETKQELDELIESQEELTEKMDDKMSQEEREQLSEEQKEINEKFEDIREQMDDLEKKNNEMEQPNKMPDTQEQQEEIEKNLEESLEKLNQKKDKKSKEMQEDAKDGMQQLSQQLQQMQMEMQSAEMEDMESLRRILENLIQLSFDEEELFAELEKINVKDRRYLDLVQEQKRIRDDLVMVEDSLFALSKRVVQIESFVNKEISSINDNIDQALKKMNDRKVGESVSRQRYVMTSMNNLALLLDEALQQMQEQMAQQMQNSSCKKPGSQGKPKPGSMKSMQQQLNEQLKQMKQQMEKGKKPGEKGKQGSGGKELVEMAAKQAKIREELRKMAEEMGDGDAKKMNDVSEMMEKTEEDIVNRNITRETLMRQEEILTRLLEAENADREREMEQKRESVEGKDLEKRNLSDYSEYYRVKSEEIEYLQTIDPKYSGFYKAKISSFFKQLTE